MANSFTIFISSAAEDRSVLLELKTALKPYVAHGLVTTWDTTEIRPGEAIWEKTEAAIASSKLAVLLVTGHFLAANQCGREISALLSAGLPTFCLYVDPCLVDLFFYTYMDSATGENRKIRLVDLDALNDPQQPLRSLSSNEKAATLTRAIKKFFETASPAEEKGVSK